MFLFSTLTLMFFSSVLGGELLIAKSPPSIKFQGDAPLSQHLVCEICSAAMGFTTQHESNWNGMSITDPFNFAEAAIVLYVDGIETLGKISNLQRYNLNNDEDEYTTWKTIRNQIMDRYPVENNTFVRLELGHGENLNDLKSKNLDKNNEEDANFLKEINDLSGYLKNVEKSDGVPDLYWFVMKSLHQLSDLKGSCDSSTVEAKEKVYEMLLKLAEVYNSIYHGRALVMAVVSDASHTRRTRSLVDEKTDAGNVTDALRENIYDPDFPVIFNMILWFTVGLIFSLLAVSIFIASMDPGRDSIIYRMTSNRMKKDS